MEDSVWICDTNTGQRLHKVEPSGGNDETRANATGSGSHDFHLPLIDPDAPGAVIPDMWLARQDWENLTRQHARTIVVERWGQPAYAGVIHSWEWRPHSEKLTLESTEIRDILLARMTVTVGDYGLGGYELSGASWRGIARDVILRATSGGSLYWNLPVTVPALELGGESLESPNHMFEYVEDLLTRAQDADGGPDIVLQPNWNPSNGRLRWEARIGSPRIPGRVHEFHAAAGEGLTDIVIRSDGRKMLTGVFTIGKGAGEDIVHGEAGAEAVDLPWPMPWRDARREFKNIDSESELDSHARAELEAHKTPTRVTTFGVISSGLSAPLWPGDTISILFPEDGFINYGRVNTYVTGVSCSIGSEKVSVTVQEV